MEVQRQNEGADAHRARYHSSTLVKTEYLGKAKIEELHDSYVIFIIENDVIGIELPMYYIK